MLLIYRRVFPPHLPLSPLPLQMECPWRLWRQLIILISGIVLYSSDGRAQQDFDTERYHRAVEFCRSDVSRPMAFSADRKILCFDGWIAAGTSMVADLGENGLFVVRSLGGDSTAAIAMSGLLRSRRATVVVYDHCLAACANFFFVASFQTYVLRDSLVAWNNRRSGLPDCTFGGRPARWWSKEDTARAV